MSLLQIMGASAHPATEGAIELLLGCHARIREFTALAVRLASDEPAEEEHVADAARRVHRYHTVALPLHQADEEESIAPRLERVGGVDVLEAVDAMKAEHIALDQQLAELVPLWDALAREPGRRAELSRRMVPAVRRMEALWHWHLDGEENIVFPALRRSFDAPELLRIAGEFRARRAAPSGG